MLRRTFVNYRLGFDTAVIVIVLVVIRWALWESGVEGLDLSPLASSIVSGGIFVMGLVIAGTLSDYKAADRAPADMAAHLYAILREAESMQKTWGHPDLDKLRTRLIAVVTALRADINAGNTRDCQEAIEEISESLLELEETDVPANYIVRLRAEQAGLRKSMLNVYHLQREEFLPSAFAMIVSVVVIILTLVMFTNWETMTASLVTVAFLSFFFLYLLRLLRVIDKPFKVGRERSDDDVSLFLLVEFVVHAQAGDAGIDASDVEAAAVEVEEVMTEIEQDTEDLAGMEEAAAELAELDEAAEAATQVDAEGPSPAT